MINKIYEVVDVTFSSEESYSCGLFSTLEEAKDTLLSTHYIWNGITDTFDDFERIEIREREISGIGGKSKVVFSVDRNSNFCEDCEDWKWETTINEQSS